MTAAQAIVLLALGVLAVTLTLAMFATRNMMLGFPSAMFWSIFGAYCFTLSSAAWDIYYVTGFASVLGMTSFSALAAYGLRERRDTIADEELEAGERGYIGDSRGKQESSPSSNNAQSGNRLDGDSLSTGESNTNPRVRALRERAARRRRGVIKKRERDPWA